MREVIRKPDAKTEFSTSVRRAGSLEKTPIGLGQILARRLPQMADRFNWIMLQFSTLPDEEEQNLQNQVLGFQHVLREQVSRYVADEATADRLAWMVFCSFFGYRQLFTTMELGQMIDLSFPDYGHFLAQVVGRGL